MTAIASRSPLGGSQPHGSPHPCFSFRGDCCHGNQLRGGNYRALCKEEATEQSDNRCSVSRWTPGLHFKIMHYCHYPSVLTLPTLVGHVHDDTQMQIYCFMHMVRFPAENRSCSLCKQHRLHVFWILWGTQISNSKTVNWLARLFTFSMHLS